MALAHAKTHGAVFSYSGCLDIMGNNMFRALELPKKVEDLNACIKVKEECLKALKIDEGMPILAFGMPHDL